MQVTKESRSAGRRGRTVGDGGVCGAGTRHPRPSLAGGGCDPLGSVSLCWCVTQRLPAHPSRTTGDSCQNRHLSRTHLSLHVRSSPGRGGRSGCKPFQLQKSLPPASGFRPQLHPSWLQEPPNTALPLRPRPPSTLQKDPAVGESHGVPGCSFPVASQKIPAPYCDLRGPSSPTQQLPRKQPVTQLVPSLPAGLCSEAPPLSLGSLLFFAALPWLTAGRRPFCCFAVL